MEILFVCQSNIGRSQMAAAFYDQLHPGEAVSAGITVDMPGQALKERPRHNVIDAMGELGIDIANNQRTQLTPVMLAGFGRVVLMTGDETVPDWVRANPDTEVWDVKDSSHKDAEQTRAIRDTIRALVNDLDRRLAITE